MRDLSPNTTSSPSARILAALRSRQWLTIFLAPLLALLLLRAPVINDLGYIDTWFYSGYGWALPHHIEVFGWLYYADRFTVILPIAVSAGLFGAQAGYLLLHYAILVATGGLLYVCVRRFARPAVAATAVVLLALDPFYFRLVLWDYTTFVALPATIAGAALWYLGSTRRRLLASASGSGALLACALFANPLSGLGIAALFAVEILSAARRGRAELRLFAARVLAATAGGLAVLVAGYLLYSAYLGFFAPGKLFEATLDFIKSTEQLAAPYQVPTRIWLKTEPRIYGPVLVCIGTITILGRSILANTLRARIAQFAVACTAIFWLYRFAVTSSVIETWWAYGMTAVTPAFAMPAILDALSRREASLGRLAVGCALLANALADLVLRSASGTALAVFEYLRTHPWELLAVLALSCAAAIVARMASARRLGLVAFVALCAAIAVLSLTPAHYLGTGQVGEFVPYGGKLGLDGYQASHDMVRLIASEDRPSSRVLLWDELHGLANVGWANLPHRGGGIEDVEAPTPIPQLSPSEVALLHQPTTRYVLALSQYPAEFSAALPALRAQQLVPRVERSGAWVGGELRYQLIEVHPRS